MAVKKAPAPKQSAEEKAAAAKLAKEKAAAAAKAKAEKAAAAAKLAKEKTAAAAKTKTEKAPVTTKATAPAKTTQKPSAPASEIHPLLKQQIEAYESTGAKLTEQNKIAMARSMGVNYGAYNWYGSAGDTPKEPSYSSDFDRIVAERRGPDRGIGSTGPSSGWGF